ncbi:MAG: hypothetical protein RI953_3125 [Pseudomonadota bacterium]|jgi:hypothetical protein
MLTRSHFSVDLWFIFGSFCYGAEAVIVDCRKDLLLLRITPASSSALTELSSFFESINEKAKALVRTEARIFVNSSPDAPAADWADELIATLMSEFKPRILPHQIGDASSTYLTLEVPDVRGLTPNDQQAWSNLVADVWPRLPA